MTPRNTRPRNPRNVRPRNARNLRTWDLGDMHPSPRRRAADRRERGTVVLLVVVAIISLAILGLAFVQVTRVQREVVAKPIDNIDLVLESIEALITQRMTEDLFDDTDRLFGEHSTSNHDIEPYDYPWSNYASSGVPIDGLGGAGAAGTANIGDGDDAWLASSSLVFSGTASGDFEWPKITTLTGGLYEVEPGQPNPLLRQIKIGIGDGDAQEVEGTNHYDTDVEWDHANLVDTDGDGIGDSRFERAPIILMTGREYFMAVRVVDLAAFVNANVALAHTDNAGDYSYSPGDEPRGWFPSELDLGGHAWAYGAAAYVNEVDNLLDVRLGAAGNIPASIADRVDFWMDGPRYDKYQSPLVQLSAEEELYLRYRHGLVPPAGVAQSSGTLATALTSWLRTADVGETAYDDNFSDAQDFFENNARLELTTLSATAEFAPPLVATGTSINRVGPSPIETGRTFGLNDKRLVGKDTTVPADKTDVDAALTELAEAIEDVYSLGTFSPPFNTPTVAEFADQFAASIQDYRDQDNLITQVGSNFGMEALPVIGETYVQREYQATASEVNGSNPANFNVEWTQQDAAGFAIEIYNPFAIPIKLTDVYVRLTTPTPTTTNLEITPGDDLDALAGAAVDTYNTTKYGVSGDMRLYPGDRILLYRDSVAPASHPAASSTDDSVSDLFTGTAGTDYIMVALPDFVWPVESAVDVVTTHPLPMALSVELRAADQAGAELPWPYASAPSETTPEDYWEINVATDYFATATLGYSQYSAIGIGQGINGLLVDETEYVLQASPYSPGQAGRSTTIDELAVAAKTKAPAGLLGADEQFVIANYDSSNSELGDDRLQYAGELAMIDIIGPNTTQTFAEVWMAATSTDDYRLDFSDGPVDAAAGNLSVPYATLLLARMSTLNPAVDGVDNDGDTTIDEFAATNDDEQVVRGKLNLNTASVATLTAALPFADANIRDAVAAAIATRRLDPDRDNPANDLRGLAYVWELAPDLSALLTNAASGTDYTGDTDAFDPAGSAVKFDFLSNERTSGLDGIADDREEQIVLLNWLQQMTATRSDVYVAYIIAKGYDTGDFAEVKESAREIVVFSRAKMRSKDDAVQVLARFRYQ